MESIEFIDVLAEEMKQLSDVRCPPPGGGSTREWDAAQKRMAYAAPTLANHLISERMAHRASRDANALLVSDMDKEREYSGTIKATLDLVAVVVHPDKSPDESWTYSTDDLPGMVLDLRKRAERAEVRLAKLEAVAEAARGIGEWSCVCSTKPMNGDCGPCKTMRALAALDEEGK